MSGDSAHPDIGGMVRQRQVHYANRPRRTKVGEAGSIEAYDATGNRLARFHRLANARSFVDNQVRLQARDEQNQPTGEPKAPAIALVKDGVMVHGKMPDDLREHLGVKTQPKHKSG